MTIQSVTNENVAEFVSTRKGIGTDVTPKVEIPEDETPVETKPESEVETPKTETKPKKNGVQERIDELTRQKKELDEFAQDEYQARLQAQRRIADLEKQIESIQTPQPKVEEAPEPDPVKYTDQKEFLKDWGEWNRKKAISDFQAEEQKRRAEEEKTRLVAEIEARRQKSLEEARKEFPDFDEKLEEASKAVENKRRESPNAQVQAFMLESDYQAHLLYYLTEHPEEVARLNKMRPAQAAIALGRLETQFVKPGTQETVASTESPKSLPEPTPTLGLGGGNVSVDTGQPMDFADYKRRRLEEIRKKKRR